MSIFSVRQVGCGGRAVVLVMTARSFFLRTVFFFRCRAVERRDKHTHKQKAGRAGCVPFLGMSLLASGSCSRALHTQAQTPPLNEHVIGEKITAMLNSLPRQSHKTVDKISITVGHS